MKSRKPILMITSNDKIKLGMTKQEAEAAMRDGKKVRHYYFSSNEWMTLDNGKYLFEDGVRCSITLFWLDRSAEEWDHNWELVNE